MRHSMLRRFLGARQTAIVLRRESARRRQGSRGQALVEFALLVMALMFIVVGATDISTLLDDHLNVVYAARAGARTGSVIGAYAPSTAPYTADCAIIGAVQSALTSNRDVQVSKIAIYKADAQGQPVSSSLEDIYAGNAVCNSDGSISPGATQVGWPPACRNNTAFVEDSLGVAITYSYTYQFNLIGITTFTTTDTAVMPIEVVTTPGGSTSGTTSC